MDALQAFEDAYLDLYDQACTNDGIEDEAVERAVARLSELVPLYADRDALPKRLVNIFIDMQAALMSAADHHDSEKANRIMQAADRLADIARDMTL